LRAGPTEAVGQGEFIITGFAEEAVTGLMVRDAAARLLTMRV
jgi:hypothetical protein